MKPGIYINLPEDEYHAIDARGSTDAKELFDGPVEFQFKRLHPEEDKDTAAKLLGSAIHTRILEGRDAFLRTYFLALDKDKAIQDGALSTVDSMKEWLRRNGENTSGKKDDLIKRILAAKPKTKILDIMVARHAEANKDKLKLTQTQWDKCMSAAEWCQSDVLLKDFMEDGTLTLGLSEVSIVAEIEGVKVKARYDHLAHHAIIDLKTFSPFLNKDPVQAIPYHIKKMGYDLQAGHYLNVWDEAKKLWQAGLVFGADPSRFDKVFARETPMWIWLFVKTVGAPQPYVRGFAHDSTALAYARNNAREAMIHYAQKVEKHGADAQWPPENKAIELGDEELLRY